jgi:general secretion pathway protein F
MPKFRYRAIDASGQMVAGVIEAASNAAVVPELEKIAFLPIEISDDSEPAGFSLRRIFARAPTREEISGISEDLATLVKGGVTLDRALLILSETGVRPAVGNLMRDLHREISAGHSLAEAVSTHPELFPKTYAKMVEVAEVAGTLDETLRVIAHERRRGENLRRRISSSLAYPAFLIVAATGVLIFVLTAIIPEFERALAGFQTEDQQPFIFGLSRMVRANTDLIGIVLILVITALFLIFRTRAARSFLMRVVGRVPGVRVLVRHEQTVVFCATLGTLTHSGVDISTGLRLIRDLMRDARSAEKIDRVVAGVRQGHRLSEALQDVDILPPYAVHMLRVGEESGELDSAAMRIAAFYEVRLDRALTRLTAILGPAIIILVSSMIAWLIISVITALLSVNDLLK